MFTLCQALDPELGIPRSRTEPCPSGENPENMRRGKALWAAQGSRKYQQDWETLQAGVKGAGAGGDVDGRTFPEAGHPTSLT